MAHSLTLQINGAQNRYSSEKHFYWQKQYCRRKSTMEHCDSTYASHACYACCKRATSYAATSNW